MFAKAFTHYALPTPLAERQMKKLWREPSGPQVLERPDDFSWMHPSAPTIPAGASPQLSGFLKKMHRTRRPVWRQWAKRYVKVDDYRGRVSVASGRYERAKTVCSLADVQVSVAQPPLAHAFVIKCGGVNLTVSASTDEELEHWLTNLQLRIDEWKRKRRTEGPEEAKPSFGAAGEDIYWVRQAEDGTWRATW